MKSFLLDGIKPVGHFLWHFEKWLLVGLVLFLTGFSLLQIVLRNFFATGYPWGDSLQRHLVLWISLLGAARATAENKHIRIDLLPRLLPSRSALALPIITDCFSLAVCTALCFASWIFVRDELVAGSLAFGNIPLWWFEVIFPISFAIMTIRFAYRLMEGCARFATLLKGRGP